MKLVIVTGMSGAGKTIALKMLEDIGFYCVDNLPAALIPKFAELCMAGKGKYDRVALVTDVRGGQTFGGLFEALDALHAMCCDYKILYIEAAEETVIVDGETNTDTNADANADTAADGANTADSPAQ